MLKDAERRKAAAIIKRHEELRLKPYKCTAGKLTLGYGRNLEDAGISLEEAELLFENDFGRVQYLLPKHVPGFAALDPVRQAVLLDMAFNLGLNRFFKFKRMLDAVERRDYATWAAEMEDSEWWKQVGTRAVRLKAMVLSGQWPKFLRQ